MLKRLLTPPIFPDDEEKTRIASLLNTVLLFLFLTPLLLIVNSIRIPANRPILVPVFVVLTGSLLGMVYFMRRGYVHAVSGILAAFLLLLVTFINILNGGQARPITIYYTLIIVIGGLLLGGQGAISFAVLSAISLGIVTYGESTGWFIVRTQPPTTGVAIITYGVGFVLIGVVLRLATESISTALNRAHAGERELSERNRELQNLSESLEQSIAERTAQLAAREAFLSGIFYTAEDAIVTVDEAQRILLFSQSAERIFGYPSSEIVGQPLDLLLPPQFIQVHHQHIHNFGEESESTQLMGSRREVYGRRKDGTEFPAEASISKLILDDKLAFTAILRDITQRRRVEKALREEEERFRRVFEVSPVAIVITTLDEGRIIDANDAYWNISGHDPKTSIGKTTIELRAGYDESKRQDFINLLTEKKSIQNPNYVFADDAGRRRITMAFFELIDLDGHPVILSMFYDMTEQVEAQNALRRSEVHVRGLLNAVPDAIFELRRDGVVLQYIPSDETSSKELSEEFLGKSIHQIMSPAVAEQIMFAVERALESGLLHIIEYQLPDGGKEKTYEARVAVSGDDTVLMMARDVSFHKWLETEREALINELDSKRAELERFSYAVSHDLKSPLITIKGFLGFLKDDVAAGSALRVQTNIQRINNAVDTMQHRLDDLLELSRAGQLTNKSEEICFNDLVAEALELVHGRISQGGITVRVDENLPFISGDHQRLLEVIQNLIDNATKFMGDETNPLIEIGWRGEEDGKPIFFVKDNGMGIPPEHHEKIFGIFNKLNPKVEGTGIGLSLVKRIIEAHGGRIWVESDVRMGSTFCFTLG